MENQNELTMQERIDVLEHLVKQYRLLFLIVPMVCAFAGTAIGISLLTTELSGWQWYLLASIMPILGVLIKYCERSAKRTKEVLRILERREPFAESLEYLRTSDSTEDKNKKLHDAIFDMSFK